ncbi:hypothetical protein E4T47_04598 [Aureobasidium subglaciale]|nr:hypothetical protein E4T47_04598 [Aureobasidium subglaciale]
MAASGVDNSSNVRWMGGYFAGEGANGTCGYWIQVDQNERIVDRMVIKDTWDTASTKEPPEYQGIYQDLVNKGLHVSDFPGAALPSERFYKEAYIQGLLTDPAGANTAYTVPLRGYKRFDETDDARGTHWRIYMDYMQAGDLHDVLVHNGSWADVNGVDKFMNKPVAEAFIWWIMECLANALIQMETVTRNRPNARVQQDEAIVMLDLKPENILLDSIRGPHYPVYPKPMVADFGSAIITYLDDPENEDKSASESTTVGYEAPEMFQLNEDDFGDDYDRYIEGPVHSYTNIWQIGRLVETLMRLGNKDPDKTLAANPPRFRYYPNFRYSYELNYIIDACQAEDPNDRYSPPDLLDYINHHAPMHNSGMKEWATEPWIAAREAITPFLNPYNLEQRNQRIDRRVREGKLVFLRHFQDPVLANRYCSLDVDLPDGSELAYSGKFDQNRIGDFFVEPQPPPPPPPA